MSLPTGSTLVLPCQSRSATEVYVTNANIDWGAEELFSKFSHKSRDFIDIGAHIGYYAVYLSPLVRRCYAFEPDPRNIPGLRANASLAGNVEVLECAVSSRTGFAELSVGNSSSVSSLEGGDGQKITVRVTTIDEFVRARPSMSVALIKTDIEGHDIEALRGMTETVALHQPLILTECDDACLPDLCTAWRYRIFAFTRDRRTHKAHFQRVSPTDLRLSWFKMLFLVPKHLTSVFDRTASTF